VNGSGLTNLNAANLTGTIPSSTLTGVNGSGLTNLNSSNLTGTLPSSTLTGVNGSGLTNLNAVQLSGQPASAYLPPTASLWAVSFLPAATVSPATVTTLYTSARTFAAGQVVVNWTTSGFTNAAATLFVFRIRIGTTAGHYTAFYFNTPGQHMTISGVALIPVTSGNANVSLEIQRVIGSGNFSVDGNDSWSATLTNIRQ